VDVLLPDKEHLGTITVDDDKVSDGNDLSSLKIDTTNG
jgi:hypothetical protein